MSDMIDKLWPSFSAEVSEQLEAIELSLVELEQDSDADVDVDALFRYFHTIKGGCAMMGFHNMESVAHASEDLLDPVRKGKRELDTEVVDTLLSALDGLKAQMLEAEETRESPAPLDDLVAKVRKLVDQSAPAADSAAPKVKAFALSFDVEMLARWQQTCSQSLKPLLHALWQPKIDEETISDHLDALTKSALDAGMTAISSLLSRPVLLQGERSARIAAAADLVSRLRFLAGHSPIDSCLNDTSLDARVSLLDSLKLAAATLEDGLASMTEEMETESLARLLRDLERISDELIDLSELSSYPVTANLVRLLRQFLREQRRSGNQFPAEIAQTASIIASMPVELEADESEGEAYITMCGRLADKLRHYSGQIDGRVALAGEADRIAEAIGISRQLIDSLMPEALNSLDKAISEKQSIVEIEADMESDPGAGEELIAWISSSGALINSQTVLVDKDERQQGSSGLKLSFLCALPMPVDEIRHQLGQIDPDRQHFELRHYRYRDSQDSATEGDKDSKSGAAKKTQKSAGGGTLRIESTTLDQFVNRVGEMVTLRNMLNHQLFDEELIQRERKIQTLIAERDSKQPLSDEELQEVSSLLTDMAMKREVLMQTDQRFESTLDRLQEDVLALRVVPVAMVFNRLPRLVRDVSHSLGKLVKLDLQGTDTRIDKSLLDILIEPLMHMVRNALDHGLEAPEQRREAGKPEVGNLVISASQAGSQLVIELRDDGAGLHPDKIGARALANGLISEDKLRAATNKEIISFIFHPGFSTSEEVTEVSGRGVGMDVVRTGINQVGGQIDVDSTPGSGTTFRLKLPLSVAIQSVVLVKSGIQKAAIPDRNVSEIVSIEASTLKTVQGQACTVVRGETLPVYRLDKLLGHTMRLVDQRDRHEVVVISDGQRRLGLIIDQVLGRSEVFVRDIHEDISAMPGVAGASILGDGSVVIIADCDNLFELAAANAQTIASLMRAS